MSKKEKRVSINALENIAETQFQNTITKEWFDIEISIKKVLPLTEMMELVQEITEACFTTDGTFVPEIMDFAIKSGVMTHYANFTLPTNLEKQYWLVYNTDAFDVVSEYIDKVQLQEIVDAANRKIEYMCDTDIVETKAKLNELYAAFEKMGEQFSDIFNGVNADDVHRVINTISESGLDEGKIVAAYLENMKKKPDGASDDK